MSALPSRPSPLESLSLPGGTLEEIPTSHKVAIRNIEKDEEIIKYGEPVAVSTRKILKGQWVHTHNLESKMWKK
jgi:altronate hydrolase